jgi:hypothetical protein
MQSHKLKFLYAKLLVFFLFIFFFCVEADGKTIVIVLDDSASMNKHTDGDVTQCIASNYALQVLLSTLSEGDKCIIITSYKKKNKSRQKLVFIKGEGSILDQLQNLQCGNASMRASMMEGINEIEMIEDDQRHLVFIGDGEWFLSEDNEQLTNEIRNRLTNQLTTLGENGVRMQYINTSILKSDKNEFLEVFAKPLSNQGFFEIRNTNASSLELKNQIENITRNYLNIPEDGDITTTIDGNLMKFKSVLPIRNLYTLIQGDNRVENILVNGIKVENIEQTTIERNPLSAQLYSTKDLQSGEVIIKFAKDLRIDRQEQIKVFIRTSALPGGINVNGVDLDQVCKSDESLPFKFELSLSDKSTPSRKMIEAIKVYATVNNKTVERPNINVEDYIVNIDIPLDGNLDTELISIRCEIPGLFSTERTFKIVKSTCKQVNLESHEYNYNNNLSDSIAFSKEVPFPDVKNAKTNEIINQEQSFLNFEVSNDRKDYSVVKGRKSFFINDTREKKYSWFCDCFQKAENHEITILYAHSNAKKKGEIIVKIKELQDDFWIRCLKLIIVTLVVLFFLWYAWMLSKKMKFVRKKGKKALFEKYNERNEFAGNKYLKPSLTARLNPFGEEKISAYGQTFRPASGGTIVFKSNDIIYTTNDGFNKTKQIPNSLIKLSPGQSFFLADLKSKFTYKIK